MIILYTQMSNYGIINSFEEIKENSKDNAWKMYTTSGIYLALIFFLFLNIIGLKERMDSGRYEYNGEQLKLSSQKEILKFRNQKIGYIHQESMLIGELNVLENIMIPLYIKGKVSEELYRRAYDLMEKLNIYELKDVKVKKLSGGEKQRVEAIRALVTQPEIVLADEPTGSLDKENGREIIKLLRDINKKDGTLILIATHDEKIITEEDNVITLNNC